MQQEICDGKLEKYNISGVVKYLLLSVLTQPPAGYYWSTGGQSAREI